MLWKISKCILIFAETKCSGVIFTASEGSYHGLTGYETVQ